MRPRTLQCGIIFVMIIGLPMRVCTAGVNAEDFQKLTNADQIVLVQVALDQFEARFSTFQCKLEDRMQNFDPATGQIVPIHLMSVEIRRLESKRWIDAVRLGPTGKVRQSGRSMWDGHTSRTLTRLKSGFGGVVSDIQSPAFGMVPVNYIIGLVPFDAVGTSADWLRTAVEKHDPVTIALVKREGADIVRVQIQSNAFESRAVELNLDRDLVPVKMEYRYQSGKTLSYGTIEVTEFMTIDDVWVPKRAIRRDSGGHIETQMLDEVKEFTFEPPTEAELGLTFPPGTEVVDKLASRAYHVHADGTLEEQPLHVAETGKVMLHGVPTGPAVLPPDQAPPAPAVLESPGSFTTRNLLLVAGAILVLASMFVAARLLRHKRHSS